MNKRLWIWVTAVFAVFAAVLVTVELRSEHKYKEEILASRLEGYADMISRAEDYSGITELLPRNIRVTVIRKDGSVIYDSCEPADSLGNHLPRPEVSACLSGKEGRAIRMSETFGIEYIYYARDYDGVIVRTALPFELPEKEFLHPDWGLLISAVILFVAMVLVIIAISRKFNNDAVKETSAKLRTQKKQMTNNIAHELRTPVTSIRGYLETLVDNPGMDEERKALFTQRAYLQTLRLSDLIRDISLITKIEEAPELLTREHLGVRKITDEVIDELSDRIEENHVTVENLIPEGLSIKGNQTLIYSIFRNLVENSLKYGGDGITIRIESAPASDGKVLFTYSDNGKGVSSEYLDRIFERFYRIPSEDAHKAEGSGLGLSIVRNAVAFHGGTVSASRLKPHGLCFKFTVEQL